MSIISMLSGIRSEVRLLFIDYVFIFTASAIVLGLPFAVVVLVQLLRG